MNKTAFSGYHPVSQFLYFVSVLSVTVFLMNPIILMISFLTSVFYGRLIDKNFFSKIKFVIFIFFLTFIINPLFSHGGMTILFYLPDGNPFTLESVIYGFFSGVMASSLILWYFIINFILSSDRIIFLFGRISPKLALFFSMILGFVPKLSHHLQEIQSARHCIFQSQNIFEKIRNGMMNFTALIQWALENSIETADSMKSRGYATGKRTFYSDFQIHFHDILLIIFYLFLDSYMIFQAFDGRWNGKFYPVFKIQEFQIADSMILICLLILPFLLDVFQEVKWKFIKLKT